MRIKWTSKASSDLARLHQHLRPVAPEEAARIFQQLVRARDRLLGYPRIGEKLEAYGPRERWLRRSRAARSAISEVLGRAMNRSSTCTAK